MSTLIIGCSSSQQQIDAQSETYEHTNFLIEETSPYLLQHAHNPVNWYPWGDAAFEKAKKEDKLVLVSIGYSSCHWCHVMEHESFEDSVVAAFMNENFVCIKVDREERPDVDQIYMNAVQLMTGSGGWPLNCFTLPDGRPVYGGTYYTKNSWMEMLQNLALTYEKDKASFESYADNLTAGIQQSELIETPTENNGLHTDSLAEMVASWRLDFDLKNGGPNRSPKFPIPNNYDFLMRFANHFNDQALMNYVDLTLVKMALGGIYDQIGGGFSRYSTDEKWKVPHFEKMLYDNGQLVSLYSQAYQRTKNPIYKQVVYQTIEWLEREMTTGEGAFMSALDADSEGEEGKFYVWTKEELKNTLSADEYELATRYYNVNQKGQWEGKYILLRAISDTAASKFDMDRHTLQEKIAEINKKLLSKRNQRVRPGFDDKVLTSWNAMMLKGLVDAAMVFNEPKFASLAEKNANWIVKNQLRKDGSLWHTHKNGVSKIDGFLDDYAFTTTAFIRMYEMTFDERWLRLSNSIVTYAIAHFKDPKSGMFFFTSNSGEQLIARKMEVNDNVVPASNSEMARALFQLGTLYDSTAYKQTAEQMLVNIQDDFASYPSGYSNWAILMMDMSFPYYEIAITGEHWREKVNELNSHYIPNKLLMG
ncbi:MAG: thioredoxin domain-containing protein, partial [Putridiphycobacter sp.]|nr:thioredoxin domain-containing protein [Putridiphycobacter sp.]